MPTVTLPVIEVRTTGLVRAGKIDPRGLSHVCIEVVPGKRFWCLVPSQIALDWEAQGISERPQSLVLGKVRMKDVGPLAAVRVRSGLALDRIKNFYVLPATARRWIAEARKYERLLRDYEHIMYPPGTAPPSRSAALGSMNGGR